MSKHKRRPLAAGELQILTLLWNTEGMTLSAAHQAMGEAGHDVGYTTVQTRLDRLVDKGLVAKNKQRPTVYTAKVAPDEVRATMLDSFLNRLSGVVPLFAHLVQDPSLGPDDLREMRRMIDEAERKLKQREEPRS